MPDLNQEAIRKQAEKKREWFLKNCTKQMNSNKHVLPTIAEMKWIDATPSIPDYKHPKNSKVLIIPFPTWINIS